MDGVIGVHMCVRIPPVYMVLTDVGTVGSLAFRPQ